MLNWVQRFNIFCFLDNQQYKIGPNHYECLLAAGVVDSIDSSTHSFNDIDSFITEGSWVFGHLSYDLKNSLHGYESFKKNKINFPPFFFFKPQIVIKLDNKALHIDAENAAELYAEIMQQPLGVRNEKEFQLSLQSCLSKDEYLDTVKRLQQHILAGDCYEINFCQEFFANNVRIDTATIFQNLIALSPNPFSAFYKLDDKYLMCASPERFILKEGNKLITQPIKGTGGRNTKDKVQDDDLKKTLYESAKDRAENVMIVDLMRNDLSKICKEGSVRVDELFGVYTYPQVHQMISTISGLLSDDVSFSQIIKALFPMGSMTGAPKKKVMELIEQYESQSRGIFSGSVGYIDPSGNFDFNVVIRSIMYNETAQYLSYQVGSGITFYSDPELEWEECLLKAEAIKKVLT
jgi:para-aminobenzoate synthetase component 1